MNKTELIDAVAAKAGSSKAETKRVIESFFEEIKNSLKKDDKVSIVGFGTWSVVHREAREGRNPRTTQPIQIPAKKVVKFKPGSELADSVNE